MAYGKDELFATHEAIPTSKAGYVKTLAVVGIVVLAIILAVLYFNLPGIGDEVKAPPGLEDAINDNIITKEKREITEMRFFYCETYYTAQVKLKPLPANLRNSPERAADSYDASGTETSPGRWAVTAMPAFAVESQNRPCWVR